MGLVWVRWGVGLGVGLVWVRQWDRITVECFSMIQEAVGGLTMLC